MDNTTKNERRTSGIAGITLLGCVVVGVVGLLAAIVVLLEYNDSSAGALCLLASAIAWGLGANAIFRD
jgi:hypothetical protein